ncbi:MAG: hypothetical protein ABIA59_09205 [Candidatus Latescibacterota bacterium]
MSLVPLGVVVVYGPWLLLCMIACGSPLQDSGTATRFLSLAYAPMFGFSNTSLGMEGPDLHFLWAHINYSFAALKVAPPVHVIFRIIEKIGGYLGVQGRFHMAGNVLGFVLLLAASLLIVRWRRDPERRRRFEIGFLVLFCTSLFVSYSFYIFGAFFFLRYYYPIYMLFCILAAFVLQDALDWLPKRSLAVRRSALAVLAVYVSAFSIFSYSQAFRSRPIYPFYGIAQWVRTHTAKDEKIGIFQCGTVGYLSDRNIINLDGKVNRQAFRALKSGCLEDYIREEGIDVVVDHAGVIDIFLGTACRENAYSYTAIPNGRNVRPSGWVAVRFHPANDEEDVWVGAGAASPASPCLWEIER